MLNKVLCYLVFVTLTFSSKLHACESCGCGIGNWSSGLLTDFRNNYVRLGYFHSGFKSNLVSSNHTDRFDYFELLTRIKISKKIRIMASMPYKLNSRTINTNVQTLSGIGDLRLIGSWIITNSLSIKKESSLFIEAGGGIVVPTGKYNAKIHNSELPENFNLGNGAIGYTLQGSGIYQYKGFGVLNNYNFTYYATSSSGYQFGRQFGISLTLFKDIEIHNIKLIPYFGATKEVNAKDQYQTNILVDGTGGNGLFILTGLNVKYNNLYFGFSWATPSYENYSNKENKALNRFSCQVSYLF